MDFNKLMKQFTTIFSVFMVCFYLGAGYFLIFHFKNSTLNKAVPVIIGTAFIIYGVVRAFRAYHEIVEVFFSKNNDDK